MVPSTIAAKIITNWEFSNLVVLNLVVLQFLRRDALLRSFAPLLHPFALFCELAFALFCADLRSFALICVFSASRPRF